MKKFHLYFFLTIVIALFLLTGCENPNRADLEKILSPGALPYLKESKLVEVSSYDTSGGNNDRIVIPAGKTATILDVPGPGVIVRIWFTVDSRDPYFLRRILLRMYWDDEEDPSVEVPFGDFFGCGFGYKQYSTPYLSMSSGGYTCYFPMPFEDNAKIALVNETGQDIIAFYYQIDYQKLEKPISRDIAYFHATWKRDIRTDYDSSYVALYTRGRGHLVGVNLNMQSYDGGLGFLEGDQKIFVDGEKRPSVYGTGTEDYFSSGWYFNKGEYAGPYNGLILKDDSLGRIAAYRFHVPDPIPFKKSIKFTIEHGHGNMDIADYSSTVYWYQLEPHMKFPSMPDAGKRIPLRSVTPNRIIEAENVRIFPPTIRMKTEKMSDYGPDWSGSKQLLIESKDKDVFSFFFEKPEEPEYNIRVYFTKGPGYGKVKIYSNNQPVGEFNGYNPAVYPGGSIRLVNIKGSGGKIELKFVVDGKDSLSSGYKTGIDGFLLDPKRVYIPDWYIIGPFPNPRKSETERLGIDSVYPPEQVVDLGTMYGGKGGRNIRWQYIVTPDNGYMNLTDKILPYEFAVCYAVTYIYSPVKSTTKLYIGSDDGAKVFLNNKQLYRYLGVRIAEPDQAEIPLELKPGWNKLLIKIENNLGGYAFYARISGKDSTLVVNADQKKPEPAQTKKARNK
jgi:hypothetical protein